MSKRVTRTVVLMVAAGLAVSLVAILGCGSSDATRGTAMGWVFTTPEGDQVLISADRTPPQGWQALANAEVYVKDHPDLRVTTGPDGRFRITGIPAGSQTLVVMVDGVPYTVNITVVAGQATTGGGHSEGGGTL